MDNTAAFESSLNLIIKVARTQDSEATEGTMKVLLSNQPLWRFTVADFR